MSWGIKRLEKAKDCFRRSEQLERLVVRVRECGGIRGQEKAPRRIHSNVQRAGRQRSNSLPEQQQAYPHIQAVLYLVQLYPGRRVQLLLITTSKCPVARTNSPRTAVASSQYILVMVDQYPLVYQVRDDWRVLLHVQMVQQQQC